MSDAHERLLAYLRQRRELGESEFVLDGLSVEEAIRVIARRATPPSAPPSAGSTARSAAAAPMPPAAPPDTASRRAAAEAAKDGDWREALKAIDAAPGRSAAPRPARAETAPAPAAPTPSADPAASEPVPAALASRATGPVPPQDASQAFPLTMNPSETALAPDCRMALALVAFD